MNWHVAWKRSARDALATLTAAAYRIDSQLAKDPLSAGESRDGDRRILIEPPLAVIFKVKSAERKVIVLRVWRMS